MITPKDILLNSKFRFGPMSLNIVDSIIDFCNQYNVNLTFIPSRRQVEYNGGYVNNWTIKDFSEYVKSKTKLICIQCDHAGPSQGSIEDDGLRSLEECCLYYNSIHIDPFKKYSQLHDAINHTIKLIKYCYSINPYIYFEIGTEYGIRPLSYQNIKDLIIALKTDLKPEIFKNILFCVIQSGTETKQGMNIGEHNIDNQKSMINLVKHYGLHSIEHNFDYLSFDDMHLRFSLGLDSANIAPGIASIESKTLYDNMTSEQKYVFFDIVLQSKKWIKWFPTTFIPQDNQELLIVSCGHYVFSHPDFIQLKSELSNIDIKIKYNITNYLISILSLL